MKELFGTLALLLLIGGFVALDQLYSCRNEITIQVLDPAAIGPRVEPFTCGNDDHVGTLTEERTPEGKRVLTYTCTCEED